MDTDVITDTAAQRVVRSRWRAFSVDEELTRSVVQAQRDAPVAYASLDCLVERRRPLACQIAPTDAGHEADAAVAH